MARRRKVSRDELDRMINVDGMSYEEIGQKIGLTASGVYQNARKYKLTTPQLSHKEALPWTLAPEHKAGKVAKYLRDLSSVGQGKEIDSDHQNTAIRWAEKLVAQGLDIDYRRSEPPNAESPTGGFYTKPALKDSEKYHLKKVLDRAKRGAVRNL